ncbi:hypothetical protein ACFL4U_03735 [Candidatus Neomarinimicrobiota bacterium]
MAKIPLLRAILVTCLLTGSTLAQSEVGAIFLLISPSATLNGLGQIGAAYPTDDIFGMYFNPANFPELPTGFSARYSFLTRTPWLENLADDMRLRCQGGQLGFRKRDWFLEANLGGYRTYLDLGKQIRTNEYGEEIGTFHSYMFANVLVYGIRMSLGKERLAVRLALGGASKTAVQDLGPDGQGEMWRSEDKLTDFGFMAELPVTVQLDEAYGSLRFRPMLGYSVSNYGEAIRYPHDLKPDPPPTMARLGYSLTISALSKSGRGTLLSVGFGREVDDLLITFNSEHTDWETDMPLGDIDIEQHLIKGEPGPQVTLHEGQEVTILDFVSLRVGKYTDISGKLEFSTRGFGISGKPLLRFFLGSFRHPIARFLTQQVDIRYNESEEEGSLRGGTTYHSISFIIGDFGPK